MRRSRGITGTRVYGRADHRGGAGTTGISPARKALRETAYAFNIANGGRTLFHGTKGATGLGDISFYGKYQLLKETSTLPALSFRVGVKAPTGDTDQIFGSGHPDAASAWP